MRSLYCLFLAVLLVAHAEAQESNSKFGAQPKFNFDFGNSAAAPGEMEMSAKFYVTKDSTQGRLVVEATITPEWHTYSTTQPSGPAGGPMVSSLKLPASTDVRLAGAFTPDRDPHKEPSTEFKDEANNPLTEETFEDKVVWTAPIELTAGVKPETLEIAVNYNGQICRPGSCIPQSFKLVAKFADYDEPQAAATVYQPRGSKVAISGQVDGGTITPGGKSRLIITAKVEPHWHVYELRNRATNTTNQPTLIVVSRKGGLTVGKPVLLSPPPLPPDAGADVPYHEGDAVWSFDLEAPSDLKAGPTGTIELGGFIGYQTCTGSNCLPPEGTEFKVELKVKDSLDKGDFNKVDLQFSRSNYKVVAEQAEKFNEAASPSAARTATGSGKPPLPMPLLILLSLAGGFILNFMPCVLPVLGLKLISFAKQGGESIGRMVAINLAYTAGLMVVFMVLATLSITIGLAWGEQMTNFWFRLGILIVTFALSLSLFGVWEIPTPGFAASDNSAQLQQQEGLSGAFFKGLFTTILGISCSGPLLGFVLGATVGLPPAYTVLVFACIGLGMASPFLALPFIPGVRNLLPKPGDWMDTFKQVMGFVMLAAGVFFFSTIENDWKIATLSLLVGVAFACWWIGKVPIYEPTGKQVTAWIAGCAAAGVIGVGAFSFLGPPPPGAAIEWEDFSLARISQLEKENRTVFVDFTADWCVNCKTNLRVAVEREDVKKLLEQNNVVAMKADWVDTNPDVEAELKRLKRPSIPLLAIYPAGRPNEVIVLDGLVLKYQVMNAIRQAGPSKVPLEKKLQSNKTLTAKVE